MLVIGLQLKQNAKVMTFAGALVCFFLRMISVWLHWSLPRVPLH